MTAEFLSMNVYLCSHLALALRSLSELAQSPSVAALLHDDCGQDMIEYALISCFIGLGTVTGIHGLAAQIAGYLDAVDNTFTNSLAGAI